MRYSPSGMHLGMLPEYVSSSTNHVRNYNTCYKLNKPNKKHTAHSPRIPIRTPILNLEPRPAAVVVGRRTGRLGHVDRSRADVVDGRVEGKSEGVARPHRDRLGAVAEVAADVAAQVLGAEVGHGAVLQPRRVRVAPDVLPRRELRRAGAELLEDVVSLDHGGQGEEGCE